MSYKLAPSILSADFLHLGDAITMLNQSEADWIHVDVMDGDFVPNISMGAFVAETCHRITKLPIDVHLMVNHPERHIDAFAKSGVNTLTIHIENNPNVHRTLEQIRKLGCRAGVALNPGTPASSLESVLEFVDMVLVMTVNPGASGGVFIPQMLQKIVQVQEMLNAVKSEALIQVDGNITSTTLPLTFKAGARVFVAATAIFKYPQGIVEGIHALRSSVG